MFLPDPTEPGSRSVCPYACESRVGCVKDGKRVQVVLEVPHLHGKHPNRGAMLEAVRAILQHTSPTIRLKASGGINVLEHLAVCELSQRNMR